MTDSEDVNATDAWIGLARGHSHAVDAIESALKSAALPSLAWYDVLLELDKAGGKGLRPFELERKLLLAQYNLSRMTARIEDAGYISRRPSQHDGRGFELVITKTGRKIRAAMWPVYKKAVGTTLAEFRASKDAARLLDYLKANNNTD